MTEKNYIEEHWNWLETRQPRVKEVLVRYEDEYRTGRSGDNWLPGAIERDLWQIANKNPETKFDEFMSMMHDAFPDRPQHEIDLTWNLITAGYNIALKELKEAAKAS